MKVQNPLRYKRRITVSVCVQDTMNLIIREPDLLIEYKESSFLALCVDFVAMIISCAS